ncbi:MAG: Txe/YoeB family addiction module toxin [Puniceicoccales bacterium]|jgi:Txe/YoeB family toxin of toxin-antitoxin system|nr:Txe/YoeB family addiction module toxin [Puniceicoccales bacterium]
MGSFRVVFTKDAAKDMKVASKSCYYPKLLELLELLQNDPYKSPPPFKYLERKLKGCISRRISMQHRLVYKMYGNVVKVISCWTHYHD